MDYDVLSSSRGRNEKVYSSSSICYVVYAKDLLRRIESDCAKCHSKQRIKGPVALLYLPLSTNSYS
jgi:hypothetical protein